MAGEDAPRTGAASLQAHDNVDIALSEELFAPGCALCRHRSSQGRRYLRNLVYEGVNDVGFRRTLDRARGFCGPHTVALFEADRDEMEVFLDRVRQLLPVLGCDLLVPVVQPIQGKSTQELYCRRKGATARGQRSPQGFVVFKGSEAVLDLRPSAVDSAWIKGLREKLIKSNILVAYGDKLTFIENYEFSSPSAAAAVVEGGHANGLIAWKTTDGKTLKEMEAAL